MASEPRFIIAITNFNESELVMVKISRTFIIVLAIQLAFVGCDNRKSGGSEVATTPTTEEPASTEAAAGEEVALAEFTFEEKSHDFGELNAGDVVTHVFKFTNSGEAPMLIQDIRTTCGCTTPEYTKEPVGPGETGEITVQFNSKGKSGVQNKNITIFANTKNGSDVVSIKCVVKKVEEVKGPYKDQPAS